MAKPIECPNCGGNNPAKISVNQYRCAYCGTDFFIKVEQKRSTPLEDFEQKPKKQFQETWQRSYEDSMKMAKRIRRVVFGIVFISFAIGIGITIFSLNKFGNLQNNITSGIPRESGWQNPSVNRFYLFEASKKPVAWSLIQQTGEKLDSVRYFISLTDPVSKKEIATEQVLETMTWDESFHFNDRWGEMVQAGDTVWVVSEKNGFHGRDIYTGKIIMDEDDLAKKFPQLKSGIATSQYQSYRGVFKLITEDGFEFIFVPGENLLMKEKDFDKVKKDVVKSYFAVSEEKRPFLFYVREKFNKYRKSGRMNDREFESYFENKSYYKNSLGVISVDSVYKNNPLFGAKILWYNEERTIVLYRESSKPASLAHISCFDSSGNMVWDKKGAEIRFLRNAFKEDMYIEVTSGKNEIAVSHRSAKIHSMGINIQSGNINWEFED